MNKIRTLIVDDSSFIRSSLMRILKNDTSIEIIDEAENGVEAIEKIRQLHPDVVILDLAMPVMDGLTALKHIMREMPTPVVVFSATTHQGTREALEALALGAVDFMTKPSAAQAGEIQQIRREISDKIKAAYTSRLAAASSPTATRERFRAIMEKIEHSTHPRPENTPKAAAQVNHAKRLVAIAASTGGPSALQTLFTHLPSDINASVVVVLHIAAGFTEALAARLSELSPLDVREASDGAIIQPGMALVAPTGLHLRVRKHLGEFMAELNPEPSGVLHRPSADVLFESIAKCCAEDTCGVILTGMGNDGALGLRAIRKNGGYTIAQDETTSVIYGMPRRAVELGGVDISLPLEQIAEEIVRVTGGKWESGEVKE